MKHSIVLSAALLSACLQASIAIAEEAPDKDAAAQQSVEWIARSYSRLRLMTPTPVRVDAGVAASCVGTAALDQTKQLHSPHSDAQVKMYMNDPAAAAFMSGERSPDKPSQFPVGSVIVKEKLADFRGVGGMIKRSPGYDSAHNDWEYFYVDDRAEIENGPITSCVQCHSRADQKDYVFGSWYRPAVK